MKTIGSGVVINAEKGYVVTNNHVVNNALNIQVKLSDNRRYNAQLIGTDPSSDIALIQLKDATDLTEIEIANSDILRVGDYTVAIGNPYNLGETVTLGIISALGRCDGNFIQTDAAINHGNSGGALLNLSGELIGINTAIFAPYANGGNIGIGFAIPSKIVVNLTSQIAIFGQVRRGELGIIGMELDSDLAQAMKVNIRRGVIVKRVTPNSSADQAGVEPGDIIISINGNELKSFAMLRAEIRSVPVGTRLKLGVLRNGKNMNVVVSIKSSNDPTAQEYIAGAIIIDGKDGPIVESVRQGSPADTAGLKQNDVILGINQKKIESTSVLGEIIQKKPNVLAIEVQRDKSRLYLFMMSQS
jgi:serine protease Do